MLTVLIIEDERELRESMVEALEDAGFLVLQAENGRVGVALAAAEQPDLVMCDVSMPELDGYGVLSELRRCPQNVTVPFIFVSGHGERRDVRAGMNLGADDYLIKPFTAEELLAAVRARLRTRAEQMSATPRASSVTTLRIGNGGEASGRISLQPGGMIADRFVIEGRAGSGGMAAVFRARDMTTGTSVAVKVLHDLGERVQTRFAREAEVLAGMHHPHIVRYIDHGVTADGEPWLAMEWLDGEDLSQRLLRGPLSVRETLEMGRCAGEALGAAHALGVLHRDVKPGNLFLEAGVPERVKLLDFGVARVLAEMGRVNHTDIALGTPSYMAPEQVTASPNVDPRVDVFSLGCVLFEALTDSPPFVGANVMTVLSRVLFEDAPRARVVRPEVSPELDDLIARMTARDPALRPANGAAAAHELAAIQRESFPVVALG